MPPTTAPDALPPAAPPTHGLRVIANRQALLDEVLFVSPAVSSKNVKPILKCLRLEADDRTLQLVANDMELRLESMTAQVQVEHQGVTLVAAELLREILRRSSAETIALHQEGEELRISDGRGRWTLPTMDPKDFPHAINRKDGPTVAFDIDTAELAEAFAWCAANAAREGTRYAFNAVLLEPRKIGRGNVLMFAGTEAHGMARRFVHATPEHLDRFAPAKGPAARDRQALVPTRATPTLRLLKEKTDGDKPSMTRVSWETHRVTFACDGRTLDITQVEGNFPPVDDVMPRSHETTVTIAAAELATALRQAELMTNEQSKGVRFIVGPDGASISARSVERGQAAINVPCRVQGPPLEIGFNPQLFARGLAGFDAAEVSLHFTQPNRVFLLDGQEGREFCLIPMNLL